MPQILSLPARLDVDAACALWAEVARTDGDIHLDATMLSHLGAAGLQVLIMARRRSSVPDSQTFLINVGPDCLAKMTQMGADEKILPRFPDATGVTA